MLTANVGCALQIQRCLRKLGHPLPVFHPAEVLAAALGVGELRVAGQVYGREAR